MPLAYSDSESKRFALNVFRHGTLTAGHIPNFLAECAEKSADVVILRMESEAAALIAPQLAPLCHTIAADQLLEFRKSLNEKTQAEFLRSGAEILEVTAENRHLLDGIVERCYSSYTNHYHANPCLVQTEILQGLVEFSHGFLAKDNRTIFIARFGDNRCGYLCMEIKDGVGCTVIGGSALDLPAATRHKVLCDMTHFGDRWLLDRKIREFKALTRTDKIYIQKLLVRNMRCLPSRTLVTLHLNLFLGKMLSGPDTVLFSQSPPSVWTYYRLRDGESPAKRAAVTMRRHDNTHHYYAELDAHGVAAFGSISLYGGIPSAAKP